MDHPTFQQGPSSRRPASPLDRHSLDIFDELGRVTVSFREEEHPVLLPTYRGVVGAAQVASRFNERLQYRLEIEGRAADDLEHIGGGGLLLQRFAQLVRARLHLVEQPHVLDRDHRLVGEGVDQLYFLVTERPHGGAGQDDHADRRSFAQQRYPKRGPVTAELLALEEAIFRIGKDVRNVRNGAFEQDSSDYSIAPRS